MFIATLLLSCEKNPCRANKDEQTIYHIPLDFTVIDENTSVNLLTLVGGPYWGKFSVTDDKGQDVVIYESREGFIQFYPIIRGEEDFQNENIKTYYLHFGQDQTDTLRMKYYLKQSPCLYHEYRDLQIFYNDSLYLNSYSGDRPTTLYFYTTIQK
ncbi:hypothetical protein [Cesiribacter andamanensis]|uniref:Uncharacterized protein n=1 Tax=Cesiribacter andamanensis AMV16 TaxID=1279009 RepID=M7NGM4_9BACT|nr:hypothetical protein [Cesiribacter andamanensis]EMR00985.1 hypothetical protein ADICEAN_03898 [Cesiribacter andamanensis AMV16]